MIWWIPDFALARREHRFGQTWTVEIGEKTWARWIVEGTSRTLPCCGPHVSSQDLQPTENATRWEALGRLCFHCRGSWATKTNFPLFRIPSVSLIFLFFGSIPIMFMYVLFQFIFFRKISRSDAISYKKKSMLEFYILMITYKKWHIDKKY